MRTIQAINPKLEEQFVYTGSQVRRAVARKLRESELNVWHWHMIGLLYDGRFISK